MYADGQYDDEDRITKEGVLIQNQTQAICSSIITGVLELYLLFRITIFIERYEVVVGWVDYGSLVPEPSMGIIFLGLKFLFFCFV